MGSIVLVSDPYFSCFILSMKNEKKRSGTTVAYFLI